MAVQQVNALQDLLGKRLVLVEDLAGVEVERRGQVVGIVNAVPGSRCSEEFFLDQDDGDFVAYEVHEVRILAVE